MPDAESIFARISREFRAVAELPEECWIVGGSVRDALIGRDPRDVDCAAPRAQTAAAMFASRTGGRLFCMAKHPLETWRVVLHGIDWDFTDLDGGTIDADLARRDFTIGALALSVAQPRELRDPFDGVRDLERGIVRMVSAANLADDPLRMLRAIRIAGSLGFEIDGATRDAILAGGAMLGASAPERITAEMDEILATRDVRPPLEMLVETGLHAEVLPFELDEASIARCAAVVSPDPIIRYASLFVGRESLVSSHADASRWSVERRRGVTSLLQFAPAATREEGAGEDLLPLLVHDHGTRTARRAVELLAAKGEVAAASRLSNLVQRRGAEIEGLRPLLDGISVCRIAGIDEGPEVGRLVRLLVEAQLRGTVRTRVEAEAFVRQQASSRRA